MRNFKSIAALCLALVAASCGKSVKLTGVIADAPKSEIVVKLLDMNRFKVLDTLRTDASGFFRYSLDIAKGQPEFIYLFRGDTKVASLLLQNGDRVRITADTLGRFSVEGSGETEKLISVEKAEADFAAAFSAAMARLEDLDASSQAAEEVRRELAKIYIAYYRDRVKYVMQNPFSLTVIPVLYQYAGENLPLFGQNTDAIHFRNAADSLMKVYPQSQYVAALAKEAQARQDYLMIGNQISRAPTVGYPDLNLPDETGAKVRLSSLEGRVVLLYFWVSESAEQKMLNLDVLKPVYDKYHPKGLDIYAVSLDVDKSLWANAVRHQASGWTNVCDGMGSSSPSLMLYNVPSVPFIYVIRDGDLVTDAAISDEASLRKYLDSVFR